MNSTHRFLHGEVLIIIASVLWATGYFFRKTVLYGISPILMTFLTACTVSLVFILVFRTGPSLLLKSFLKFPLLYLLLAITGVGIGTSLMFLALDNLDLGVAVILEKLQPVFTALFAMSFLGERIRRNQVPLMLIAIIASYLVAIPAPWALNFGNTSSLGVLAVLGAALSWGFSSVVGKQLTNLEPDVQIITVVRFVLGSIILLPFFLFRDLLGLQLVVEWYVLTVTVLCAVFCSGAGYLLFYRGLKTVSATTSGFLELVTPICGTALGVAFLGEQLTLTQLLGAMVLLCAVFLLTKK